MPCDSKIVNTVEWNEQTDIETLKRGLAEFMPAKMRLNFESDDVLEYFTEDYKQSVRYYKKAGKMYVTADKGVPPFEEETIKNAYSHAVVHKTAERLRWKLKKTGENKYEVRRRG